MKVNCTVQITLSRTRFFNERNTGKYDWAELVARAMETAV